VGDPYLADAEQAEPTLRSLGDIESFMVEYYAAWGGTDEDRIMSYYAEDVTIQIPGSLMQGQAAVREQFVRPFITAFAGNRHFVKNIVFERDVAVIEFTFKAEHNGPFAGHAATDASIELPGCGFYEYDSARRKITAARIYFDVGTLLKQIIDQRDRSGNRDGDMAPTSAITIAAPMEHLDLASMIEISQAFSGEMAVEKQLDTLMRMAVKHAGAERALLILLREGQRRIAAEAKAGGDGTVIVHLCDEPASGSQMPETVLRHVLQTRESVILDDAAVPNPFSADPYIIQHGAHSVFCLPLMNQAKLIGILYLENNLAPGVFASARTAVLKLLASQAAISIDISQLYRDLADRERKIRRLVDANILGIFIWNIDGAIVEANDAFLTMLQYTRDEVISGSLRWCDRTPIEWREQDERLIAELLSTGTFQQVEKEYFRKDGSRVPVLLGGALFEGSRNEGVAFVLDLSERNKAQKALHESEGRFHDYAETTSDWLWEIGPDYKFVLLTENGGMTGPDATKRVGRARWDNALDLETEPEKWRLHRETLDSRKPFRNFVYCTPRADGTPAHVKVSGKPVYDANGEFRGYRGTGTDVTEIIHAQQALRESEGKFRDYAETASDWLWEMGPDCKFTSFMEGADIVGPKRIGTARWDHALDLEAEPEKWRLHQETLDSRKPFRNFVYSIRTESDLPMHVKVSGKPVYDSNGEFRGYRGTGTDVTAIIHAQEALRESERSFRSAIDGIPGLVGILNANGEVEAVNRQIMEYSGQTVEELKNWGTNGTVHPEDLPRVAEVFGNSIATGVPYQIEQRLRRFDGEYRWFDNRGIPVRDDSGHVKRWYVLLTDIEDRTHALARLHQMQSDFARMNRVGVMGELAATLSHEITQPIASARNNARAALNFLDRQPPDLAEVREALGCVVGDADRAGNIVDRIREHLKKAPPRKERFDLNAAIDEVMVLARSAILGNGVSVQHSFADELPFVEGDRVQLQQVALNLILNAVEAMGSVKAGPRELLISTEQKHECILVAVRDSGPGVDPDVLKRVFEPFYTTKTGGTGMGLAICRSIVDAHGGRLWAEANEPRGAVFQFTLPGV
jgi:PAS domain S-box-containing protein